MIDITAIIQQTKQIELQCKLTAESILAGAYHSIFKGTGANWESLRPYNEGEDSSNIDWLATARSGSTIVKTYKEERSIDVVFIVDCSLSMMCSTTITTKFDNTLLTFALISLAAAKNNDSVFPYMFAEHVMQCHSKGNSINMVTGALSEMISFQDKSRNELTSAANALQHVISHHHKPSIIFLISDFSYMSDDFQILMNHASKKHELISIKCSDQNENLLKDEFTLIEPETNTTIDNSESNTYDWSPSLEISVTDDSTTRIINYFRRRSTKR